MRYWKKKDIAGDPLVGMVIATYRQSYCLRALIASLQAQTYGNFVCLVIHDGPADDSIRAFQPTNDPRFVWIETEKRANAFGHNLRQLGFDRLLDKYRARYVCTTNGDGYYVPVYFEAMVHRLQSTKSDLVFCNLVHSHERNGKLWQEMITQPKRGHVDLGCWMADAGLVQATPWTDFSFAGDWTHFERMAKRAGPSKMAKVDMTLYVHN